MKKLHILIPSLVATASMPLVSMVGCGNPDTPTPPEPEPEPTGIVLNQLLDEVTLSTKQTYDIAMNTRYDFTIDMRKMEIWDEIKHFTFIFWQEGQGSDAGAVPLTLDFEFKIGSTVLNGERASDEYIGNIDFKDPYDIELMKTAQYIKCYVNTDIWEGNKTKKCYFRFFGAPDDIV